jgi:hypothetical protein
MTHKPPWSPIQTSKVTPLHTFTTVDLCTSWPATSYGDRVRYSTTPQPSLHGLQRITMDDSTPWCQIPAGEQAYVDTMRVQSAALPLYFPNREALLRAVYYFLHRMHTLEARKQFINPSKPTLDLVVVDGELTLLDEALDRPGPRPLQPSNKPIAARVLSELPGLLGKAGNKKEVVQTAESFRDLGMTRLGVAGMADHVRKLMAVSDKMWPFVGRGNFGCVVGDDNHADIVHKLPFVNVSDEELDRETRMTDVIKSLDPASEWSIVPDIGVTVPDIKALPADTIAQCGVHDLKKRQIVTQTLMRGGITLQKTPPGDITSKWFIWAVGPLFTGMFIMQNAGLAHLDIKSDNIIRHNDVYKYIDFGLCGNTEDALGRIGGIQSRVSYNYPPEFYCWLYWNTTYPGRPPLEHIFDTWYSMLPPVVKTEHGGSGSPRPDYLTMATAYLHTVDDEGRYRGRLESFKGMFSSITIWQLGITIARAIHDAFQANQRTGVVIETNTNVALNDLKALGQWMTHEDPTQRPTIADSIEYYRKILAKVLPAP